MGDGSRTRSDVWLHILSSLLSGTDIALLKEPAQLAKIADELEQLHHDRFSGKPTRVLPPRPPDPGTARAIVAKWNSSGSASNRIMCIKELRTKFNWSLQEAKAFADKHWNDPQPQMDRCPVCDRQLPSSDLGWSTVHQLNVCPMCSQGDPF
jgi:hypothetical protein